jgi:hypothetical protein
MEQRAGNISELVDRAVEIRPKLGGHEGEFRQFCRLLIKLLKVGGEDGRSRALQEAREEIQSSGASPPARPDVALKFACSAIVDVVAQGWELEVPRSGVELKPPQFEGATPDEIKRRIRDGHLLERDAQLRQSSVREFIKTMEQQRLGPKKTWASITSLMRDGRDLALKLYAAAREESDDKKLKKLRACVSPYVQVVEPGIACEFTGLKLTDIWRYFRHTWVSTYKSLPGRSMLLLIRDAAAPNHPVMGIAALGSSMAQQTQRDKWIGWDSETFANRITEKPTARLCRWVHESIKRLLGSIYVNDLMKDGIVERQELKKPTQAAIGRLLREHVRAGKQHRRFPGAADHKSSTNGNGNGKVDWEKQAKTPLFRSKRAKTLALLLGIRESLQNAGLKDTNATSLKRALATPTGRHAIRQLVRLVKAEHVGVNMMDIIICGAIPPYNTLLGGKLVCLLLTSPKVIQAYRMKYSGQASIIASSVKGRAVVRTPNLVLLATTSLYGVGSSQYNRIRVPLSELDERGDGRIEYCELGVSKGYGSYHFSQASIDYLETLLGRAGGGRKVNSIFGEGVNPLMRKLRDGLVEVGLPADDLLKHGNSRVVYGVPLASNFRDVLLGLDKTPKYFLALKKAAEQTELLAEFWRKRWLAGRIARDGTIEEVTKHTLSYPITHGARVILPSSGEPL